MDHVGNKCPQLPGPHAVPIGGHLRWQGAVVDDAGGDRVLEVVRGVGDAVSPADHETLGCGGPRAGPAVVADAVKRLGAQVERGEHLIGAPHRVVVALVEVRAQRVL